MKIPKYVNLLIGVMLLFFSVLISTSSTQLTSQAEAKSENTSDVFLPFVAKSLPPIIPDTTEVLTSETTDYLVAISADGSEFTFSQMTPELSELDPGDVMVSGVNAAAPYGFLRRVTNVNQSGGQVVVTTTPATLEDAIQQGVIHLSRQLTPVDVEEMVLAEGVSLAVQPNAVHLNDSFVFELYDVVLYDEDGDKNTTNDQLKANGRLELAPGFDFNMVARNRTVEELSFLFNVEETVELEFQVEVDVGSVETSYEIARLRFGTITVLVGTVPPVPVVFVVEMPIYLRGDGNLSVGVTTKVVQTANLVAGLRYKEGDWEPVKDIAVNFTFDPPTPSAGVDLKGYIDPPLSLLLYGITGPYAGVDPYLKFTADAFASPWWELHGGIEAIVGVRVELLGRTLADHRETVIQYDVLLAQAHTINRVSVASGGTPGNGSSWQPAITPDGRYVAFSSDASNLVSDDTNETNDIFLHDTRTGQTSRVSVTSTGTEGNDGSWSPAISADGRYVAFVSYASNLVPDDTNEVSDIFLHDTQTGETRRISVDSNGTEGNGNSWGVAISADGRYAVFQSNASNLVPDDTNEASDIFLYDTQTGETRRISVTSEGVEGNDHSTGSVISANGRYVVFQSDASNLVTEDTNEAMDIFMHDTQTGQTRRISIASDGTEGNDASFDPTISADGRYVAFKSQASNLVPDDSNWDDLFVYDTQTGQISRISGTTNMIPENSRYNSPAISGNGRYVAFTAEANVNPIDTNRQVFVYDMQTGQTRRISEAAIGTEGNGDSYSPAISTDGRYIAFESEANNLIFGDVNEVRDIFVYDRGN